MEIIRLENREEDELLINLGFKKKKKRMLNNPVSNRDVVKLEANQSRQGEGARETHRSGGCGV